MKNMGPIRVVIGKVGLDGHDRGAKIIARAFRDSGMEVIYTGIRRTPEELATIVLQEDADVLGLSILSGAVLALTKRVVGALQSVGMHKDDIVLVVGGIISPKLAEQLKEIGVYGAFGPGTALPEIIEFVKKQIKLRRAASYASEEA